MKAVLFYEMSDVSMDKVIEVYPRHKQIVDQFVEDNKIIAIGSFSNPTEGAMAILKDKFCAEEFIKEDPFVLEGIVAKVIIKEWKETLL